MQDHGFILEPKVLYKNGELSDKELSLLKDELESVFQPRVDPTDLTKELRMCAEKELSEEPDTMRANIEELKRLISEEKTMNPRTDDLFMAAFLRGRKHDVEKAFQCLKNFYEFKHKYPDMYRFVYPSRNPEVYDQNHFGNLAGLDRKGRRICVVVPARVNVDRVPMSDTFKLGTSILEMMLNDIVLQIAGTVIIFDMGGLSLLMQARLITPSLAWHLALIIQVFFHGNDMESLHKHIDPENLPLEYGGTKDGFSIKLTRTLLHLNEHKFKEWEKFSWIGKT